MIKEATFIADFQVTDVLDKTIYGCNRWKDKIQSFAMEKLMDIEDFGN